MTFYHLMNMRSPIDGPAQQMLLALQDGYKLSLPVEADPTPEIVPTPQAEMVHNGIVGVYVTREAALREEMVSHLPWVGGPFEEWLINRPTL